MNAQACTLETEEIQGNILAGFNKDHASFLFFTLPDDPHTARAWLAEIVEEVATTIEVAAFNELFRTIKKRHHYRETVEAAWMNLAFTVAGLRALGVSQAEIDQLPADFREGMRARADQIGDVGDNAPVNWPSNLGAAAIHVLMTVAADSAADRNEEVAHFARQAARRGLKLVFQQDGMTRRDAPGHEHFGFKDGISQPGIRGFTTPETNNPDQGQGKPGQDLIEAGEFVLGYRRQGEDSPPPPSAGYRPGPGDDPLKPQPGWLRNGSFLVFRRLTQDVAGFQDFVRTTAASAGMTEDLLGAKLVGRSGAPLEGADNATRIHPLSPRPSAGGSCAAASRSVDPFTVAAGQRARTHQTPSFRTTEACVSFATSARSPNSSSSSNRGG